jgi:hypothetical protein
MNKEQETFIKYVRTKMIFSLRLRNENDMMQSVHISSKEIKKRFLKVNYKDQIRDLVDSEELEVTVKGLAYYFKALKSGGYDLSLMQVKPLPQDNVTQTMLHHLRSVTMPADAERTFYFDLFLKYKDKAPYLFFKVDNFSGRVYTPVTNQHRIHRPYLKLYDKDTTGLDVQTMQPLLLGKILTKAIGTNDFSTWLNDGKDIYLMLQHKAKLSTRDEAKKRFFEILFSKPSNSLSKMFGSSNWITWINEFKALELPENPHNKEKTHSNLAWLLQTTEVQVMRKVWNGLVNAGIPFLSIHDEVIIQTDREHETRRIFSDIMTKEFTYFKINGKFSGTT